MKVAITGIAMLALAGCTWVKPTQQGAEVSLVKAAHVQECKKLGSTTSQVKDSVGFIERRDKNVTQELINLAKNEAAKMGGDTIVAKEAPLEGRQTFAIYDCQ